MKRRRLPQLELLEDRTLPAVFGIPWPDASYLSISFAPDGTDTSAGDSNLFATMEDSYPQGSWQYELLRAFQTWTEYANINFGLVSDSGDPLGTDGVIQGDTRFGDIRLFAYDMSPEVVALATPFDLLAGTWSGDIKLNSDQTFGTNGYDLYSIFLHEIGHVLGLDHSTDPSSALYEDYLTLRTGLTEEDIARLQALYGPRLADNYDTCSDNGTFEDASRLNLTTSALGDLTTRDDVDFYSFRLTGRNTSATIYLDVSGLSLLSAQLSVYDENGNLVSTTGAEGAIGADLSLHLDNLRPAKTYYVKVEGATDDAFSIGSYRLDVIPDNLSTHSHNSAIAPPNAQDNSPSGAISLQQRAFSTDARFDYVVRETLDNANDVDFYRVQAPSSGNAQVMTVFVWGLDGTTARPRVTLYAADGTALEAEVLVNEDGSFVVQLPLVKNGGTYLIGVSYERAGATSTPTNYFLGVDFAATPIVLDTISIDQAVTPGTPDFDTLLVSESQLFHFILSATSGPVRTEIIDTSGQVLGVLQAEAGTTSTDKLFLSAGTYTIRVIAVDRSASYSLRVRGLSDPIGPTPLDLVFTPLPLPTPGASYIWQQSFTGVLVSNPPTVSNPVAVFDTTAATVLETQSVTASMTPSLLFTGSAAESVVLPSSSLDSFFSPRELPLSSEGESTALLSQNDGEVTLTASSSPPTPRMAQMEARGTTQGETNTSTRMEPKGTTLLEVRETTQREGRRLQASILATTPTPSQRSEWSDTTKSVAPSGSALSSTTEENRSSVEQEDEKSGRPLPENLPLDDDEKIVAESAAVETKEKPHPPAAKRAFLWLLTPITLLGGLVSGHRLSRRTISSTRD